jgi:hypothetical protein
MTYKQPFYLGNLLATAEQVLDDYPMPYGFIIYFPESDETWNCDIVGYPFDCDDNKKKLAEHAVLIAWLKAKCLLIATRGCVCEMGRDEKSTLALAKTGIAVYSETKLIGVYADAEQTLTATADIGEHGKRVGKWKLRPGGFGPFSDIYGKAARAIGGR